MKTDPKPLLYWAGAGFLAIGTLLAFVVLVGQFKQWGTAKYQDYNTITVIGEGEITAIPDVATFSYTIESNMKTVADSQADVTKKSDAVLEKLSILGIKSEDIKTDGYNSYPRYEYTTGADKVCFDFCPPTGRQVLVGYTVSHSLSVKVRDLAKAGDVAQALGQAGVQNISGPNFEVDDIEAIRKEARTLAIDDARNDAKDLSKSLNVRLGRLVSFADPSTGGYPIAYESANAGAMMKMADVAVAAPTLPAGESKVTANVQLTYRVR